MDFDSFDLIDSTEDTMCLAHMVDPYLRQRVEQFATAGECTICHEERLAQSGGVVNLEHLARVVFDFAERSYDHEGSFFEGEQFGKPLNTPEVVEELLWTAIDPSAADLVCELTAGLINEERDWFEPYDMDHRAAVQFEWEDFEQSIKHESRLLSPTTEERPTTTPERNFVFVRSMLVLAEERSGLLRVLEPGTELFRARTDRDARALEQAARKAPARLLGPAPIDVVAAGRMNAQGVPMFYVALDAETACAEVASHSPYNEAVVGTFVLQQQLRILDLSKVPPTHSIFKEQHNAEDERLNSLSFYVDRITRPVILDGNHPVDYVATQVLTEAFRWWTDPQLDGIAYPSRVREGGTNVVLFFGEPIWFESENEQRSRLDRYEREHQRDSEDALFNIDFGTVRRYRVKRALTVENNII